MAEWLGIGLQNRVQRFESARDLKNRGSLLRVETQIINYFLTKNLKLRQTLHQELKQLSLTN